MKRIIFLLLMLMLLFVLIPEGYCENIDLSGMKLSELIAEVEKVV